MHLQQQRAEGGFGEGGVREGGLLADRGQAPGSLPVHDPPPTKEGGKER